MISDLTITKKKLNIASIISNVVRARGKGLEDHIVGFNALKIPRFANLIVFSTFREQKKMVGYEVLFLEDVYVTSLRRFVDKAKNNGVMHEKHLAQMWSVETESLLAEATITDTEFVVKRDEKKAN